ncbi:MAG: shikimate dehydrogenase family protein, partial [Candidatus Bipolaricaulia bacterium]
MELEKLEGYQRFVTNDLVAELEKYFPEGSSTLCGIVGGRRPSSYSLSPSLWNTAYRILKIDAVYIAFDVSVEPDHNNLIAFIDRLVGDDRFRVLSITDPYKQTVLQHLNTRGEVDGVARQIGAVNTIIRTEAGLCGYNTDGVGMARNLSSVIDLKEGRVLQLGAGGAGRAIAHGLTERMGNGVYYLLNRTVSRAKELAASLERADHRLEIRPLGGAADR